jgi:hypothetical protein
MVGLISLYQCERKRNQSRSTEDWGFNLVLCSSKEAGESAVCWMSETGHSLLQWTRCSNEGCHVVCIVGCAVHPGSWRGSIPSLWDRPPFLFSVVGLHASKSARCHLLLLLCLSAESSQSRQQGCWGSPCHSKLPTWGAPMRGCNCKVTGLYSCLPKEDN